jgi:sugar phosphate isomerase/epimerase
MKMFRNMPLEMLNKSTGLREKLRLAVVGSFEGIDINIEEVTLLSEKHSIAYVKGMIDSFNIKTGAWSLPFSLDAEGEVYSEGLKQLEVYAKTAKGISSPLTLASIHLTDKQKLIFYAERLNLVSDILSRYGCKIGLDVVDNNGNMKDITSFGQISELCKTIESGNAGIVLNARHWHLAGGSVEGLKQIAGKNLFYVKVGDVPVDNSTGRYLPGETGVVDLPAFLKVLAEIDYDGPVTPEMPDRNLMTLPEEMAVRLLGGSTLRVWNETFIKTEQG